MQCSICSEPVDGIHPETGEVYWTGGHNAEPVNDGRCCTVCNDMVVIPSRIKLMAKTKWKCPSCTEDMTQDGIVFVEEGEWDGKAYEQEKDCSDLYEVAEAQECDVVKCACGMRIAVIGLPRK
jgi:hypothetical protein